ncbi:MAG: type II toxin-antitoxin system RelE/ParE family toxin [Defluviitaleaceae bacterium]|nr:type II toxin-antitoxin system RelE/ParE family toxin [Defluviitaleaceae bacterium]
MANIILSPQAETDLLQIGNYITRQVGSPKNALNIIRNIKTRLNELKHFPLIGRPVSAVVDVDTNYRFIGCGSYLAFYRNENDFVYIDRILHNRQDYITLLFGKPDN